jgi:hypothetical protein
VTDATISLADAAGRVLGPGERYLAGLAARPVPGEPGAAGDPHGAIVRTGIGGLVIGELRRLPRRSRARLPGGGRGADRRSLLGGADRLAPALLRERTARALGGAPRARGLPRGAARRGRAGRRALLRPGKRRSAGAPRAALRRRLERAAHLRAPGGTAARSAPRSTPSSRRRPREGAQARRAGRQRRSTPSISSNPGVATLSGAGGRGSARIPCRTSSR